MRGVHLPAGRLTDPHLGMVAAQIVLEQITISFAMA